eukprot:7038908-Pyramimonas_sp.AAC.1
MSSRLMDTPGVSASPSSRWAEKFRPPVVSAQAIVPLGAMDSGCSVGGSKGVFCHGMSSALVM